MTVSWLTPTYAESFVHLTDASGNVKVIKGTDKAATYTFQSAYESAPYVSGYIHHVTVSGLSPAEKYSYQCGDSTTMSSVFTFTSPPSLGPNVPFRFGVMGDMGQTNNSEHTMQMMIDGGYQHNLLIGDLSYVRPPCPRGGVL